MPRRILAVTANITANNKENSLLDGSQISFFLYTKKRPFEVIEIQILKSKD